MEFQIVVDSCCDLTPELKSALGAAVIPLTIMLGNESFIDDGTLDIPDFMKKMKACTEKIGSAAPSPILFKEAYMDAGACFAVTLSGNLSASYANAVLGKTLAEEEGGAGIHVFDSKSASAGEVLVAIELKRLIGTGLNKDEIITSLETFIRGVKTYFVLNNLDNLLKNGRLNKIVGKIIGLLGIKPLMGSDGDGNIALYGSAFGPDQVVEKLAGTVAKQGRDTAGRTLVIAQSNNTELAEKLRQTLAKRYDFKDILVVPTRGVSSVYADDGGVVMAY